MSNNPIKTNPKAKTGKDIFNLVRSKQNGSEILKVPQPVGDVQSALVSIWSRVLGITNFAVEDDFFKTGGNSIKAVQLASQISVHFKIPVALTDIFLNTTIVAQEKIISEKLHELVYTSSIISAERPSKIPLSYNQERLWVVDKLEGSIQYHIPLVFKIEGKLNLEALSNALREVIKRHEVLRTVIRQEDGKPYQFISRVDDEQLNIIDTIEPPGEAGLTQIIERLVNEPFDLSSQFPVRATLITSGNNQYLLVITIHHIAADGWSMSVLANELMAFYQPKEGTSLINFNQLPVQYADFALWQRKEQAKPGSANDLLFWKNYLSGSEPIFLPSDFQRPVIQSIKGATFNFSIPEKIVAAAEKLASEQGTTLFNTLFCTFNILLSKYTGQQDICVGTVVANRSLPEFEKLVGFFANTLPIRNQVNGKQTFFQLLEQVKSNSLSLLKHQHVPLEKIIEVAEVKRDLANNPLFNIVFVLQNTPAIEGLVNDDFRISQLPVQQQTSKFDITFILQETNSGVLGEIEYCTDLFTIDTIGRFADHYQQLLISIVENPNQSAYQINMLTGNEKWQLLVDFNDTALLYPSDKTFIDLFEEQVNNTPGATAVVFNKEQIDYATLNYRANQVANYLTERGLPAEALVPVCIDRSINMIVGILGVLKAGAAYVPIDPAYPAERIEYMLTDCQALMVISDKKSRKAISSLQGIDIIELEAGNDDLNSQPGNNLLAHISPGHLAYVIYTSGSSGKPKGVMIEHRNIFAFLSWCHHEFDTSLFDVVFASTSICFDLSVFELFYPLSVGKKIRLLDDGLSISRALHLDTKILLNTVPSVIDSLLKSNADFTNITLINMAGEPVTQSILQALDTGRIEVRNLYGPTEDTTYSTFQKLTNGKPILIGKPIANTQVYIVDTFGELVAIGIAGEIVLGGAGVARGYLNQPKLTSQKFIADRFTSGSSLLYQTGDMGRWLPNGTIEYLGRKDDQVKIRGYRVELGEVEEVVRKSDLVSNVVVVAKNNNAGSRHLVGYVVANEKYSNTALTSYLKKQLPDFMVPAVWVELESIPLTPNGKVDKKALPGVGDAYIARHEYAKPTNQLQHNLVDSWQRLLGIKNIGIKDNFFELGGDSILAIQMVSRLKADGYDLQPRDIFLYQDIETLAQAISANEAKEDFAEQGLLTGEAGLLPVQHWLLNQGQPNPSYFNQSILLSLNKEVSLQWLQLGVDALIKQHDALRFKYEEKEGSWKQYYGSAGVTVTQHEVPGHLVNVDDHLQEMEEKYQSALSIEKGELVKVVLIKMPEAASKNRLLIIVHHLAIDGVSWRILLADLDKGLNQIANQQLVDLGKKTASYRQWYKALQHYGRSIKVQEQKSFWSQILHSNLPLRTEFAPVEKPVVQTLQFISKELDVDATSQLLKQAGLAYNTNVQDILLTALYLTLSKWNNNPGIKIWLEGHGREPINNEVSTDGTVGWFTSLYPIVFQPQHYSTGSLIKSIKEQLRQVPDKGLGFGVLTYLQQHDHLKVDVDYDVVFNYLGQIDSTSFDSNWFSPVENGLKALSAKENFLMEKLSVSALISSEKLAVNWSYSTSFFSHPTMLLLTEDFDTNLRQLIDFCLGRTKTSITPSDVGLAPQVSFVELDHFLDQSIHGVARRDLIESIYPLSGLQEGLLFHHQLAEVEGAYIQQFSCDILNPDIETLNQSWQRVLAKHSILRTAFIPGAFSIPVQCVFTRVSFKVNVLGLLQTPAEKLEETLAVFCEQDRKKGFNIDEAPLLRLTLLQFSKNKYRMVFTYHHILIDGWSMPVLINEVLTNYKAISNKQEPAFVITDRFQDYIRYLNTINNDEQENFWRNYLKDIEEKTLLPFVDSKLLMNSKPAGYKIHQLKLSATNHAGLLHFAQQHRLTINTILQGVWAFLLHKYAGGDQVVFGNVVSGRPAQLPHVNGRVGLYINTLPLVATFNGNDQIVSWLQGLQQSQAECRQFQYTPLNTLQQIAGVKGDWFDTLFVYENYPSEYLYKSEDEALIVDNFQFREQTNYALTILVNGSNHNIDFNYNSALLKHNQMEQVCMHFEHVLHQFINVSNAKLDGIRIITDKETEQLNSFNTSAVPLPEFKSIVQMFKEQVQKTPLNNALVYAEETLTYQQLDELSDRVARFLVGKGVKPGMPVPVCIERSPAMIVAILGIMKASGAYVPVDPSYPVERIRYMVNDTGAKWMVTTKATRSVLHELPDIELLELPGNDLSSTGVSLYKLPVIDDEQLAYIIYTSGSTGHPKGVMIEHKNLFAFVDWCQQHFASSRYDIVYASTSICFDLSVFEIFFPLTIGKQIRIIDNGLQIAQYLQNDRKVLINTVPMVVENLLKEKVDLHNVSVINMAGEPIPQKVLDGLDTQAMEVRNLYGPSEDTTYSTVYRLHNNQPILIGKPIAHTQVYIVDRYMNLVPVGIPGEICLAGAGLARGYWNNASLTDEKFIDNKFDKSDKLYRTGDLGRWLPDGNIEYLGRLDDQVKIRGFRIELAEIETVLVKHSSVKQTVVVAKKSENNDSFLVAYVVPEKDFDKGELINYLQSQLPDFMVPRTWVQLQALPYTPNGKVDKKSLPEPGFELSSRALQLPTTQIEVALSGIWKSLLNKERIGVDEDFFELGGHSILATRLVSAIAKELNKEVSIRDVFAHTTISTLGKFLSGKHSGHTIPPLVRQQRPAAIPLSFSQERLWFIHNFEGSVQYHIPVVLKLTGPLNIPALTQAFQLVINRHEILRTVYVEQDGIPYQNILDTNSWTLDIIEAAAGSSNGLPNLPKPLISALVDSPFNFGKDHMIRATVITAEPEQHFLVIVMHHIASDGGSLALLINEVTESYHAFAEERTPALPLLAVQYADYSIWQRANLTGTFLQRKIDFWKQKLHAVTPLELPADVARSANKTLNGATIPFKIDARLTNQLKEISQQSNCTLFMAALTVFKMLMYRYSGQRDICVGSPIANRNTQQVENLIGFFVNTIAIRTEIDPHTSFKALLDQVKRNTLEAYDNQDVPFEKLVEAIVKDRDAGRSPIFQVVFSLQDANTLPSLPGNLQISGVDYLTSTSKFELSFNLQLTATDIEGTVEYNTDLFNEERISRMIEHYLQLTKAVVSAPGQDVGKYSFLGRNELAQLNSYHSVAAARPALQETLISLIGRQAKENRFNTALQQNGETLTYDQLHRRTNRLAAFLIEKGVQKETFVPLYMERSMDLVIGMIAVMKAGGAYVPIDPSYPMDRVTYMIKDCNGLFVITDTHKNQSVVLQNAVQTFQLDDLRAKLDTYSDADIQTGVDADNLAYLIYTSGSTGLPKGVMVPHRGVVNLVNWHNSNFQVTSRSKATAMAGIGFDAFGWEIFPYLCTGASVQIIPDKTKLSMSELIGIVVKQKITHTFISTAVVKDFVSLVQGQANQLKYVLTGGDRLTKIDTSNLSFKIYNNYGPTEYSVVATTYEVPGNDAYHPPIGKPIGNTCIYIVDEHINLAPLGVPGEICIGGAGLARGYYNRPELTREKFITHPFDNNGLTKLYRTGDVGKWTHDGNIEFVGRLDDQVKIRGFRIELGEIETTILKSTMVKEVVVLAKQEKSNNKRLVAWVVTDSSFEKSEVIDYLGTCLPNYMIPSIWMVIDALPLTANGKIDKTSLPAVDWKEGLSAIYSLAETDLEKKLVTIWEELLGVSPIGIDDNFFEVGGHSLLTMRLIANIQKQLEIEVAVKELFEFTTIRQLAEYLDLRLTANTSEDDGEDYDLVVI